MAFSPSNIKSNGKKLSHNSPEKEKQKDNQMDLFLNDFTETGSVRTGPDYQADIPPFNENDRVCTVDDRSALLWSPPENLSDADYYEYVVEASKQYKYSLEQALGFLQWHNHDVSQALRDLPHYVPVSDEWSVEDILVFEQAFAFNGKCFHRIQQMLPNKTMASLVKFYYSWKKRATKESSSHIDLCDRNEALSDDDVKSSTSTINGDRKRPSDDQSCRSCSLHTLQLYCSPKGKLCSTCFMHFRRTGKVCDVGKVRDTLDRRRHSPYLLEESETDLNEPRNHKAPKSMNLSSNDFLTILERSRKAEHGRASGSAFHREVATDHPSSSHYEYNSDKDNEKLMREIRLLRERSFKNRFALAQMRKACTFDVNSYKPSSSSDSPKTYYKWNQHEIMLALQGFRMFGKKFHCISDLLGTKTADHVRSFYNVNRHKYDIDSIISELEEQKREENDAKESDVIVVSDEEQGEADVVTIDDDDN